MVGSLITTKGKNIMLYRAWTENGDLSATEYLAPTQFKISVNETDPLISETDLTYSVPISDGVLNDDGDNTLTGSNGGTNSTDNTTTYKEGAGVTDNTSQNLITNATSATKTWTIADLSSLGTIIDSVKFCGLWFYIKDATTLAYFKTTGTVLQIKLGSDASNYYSIAFTAALLSTGWNWLTSTVIISAWTETGTVSGNIDTFILEVTTNNATDSWASADVIYDMLRTWAITDLLKDYSTGYPTFDYINNKVTTRGYLTTLEANGFLIDGYGDFNEDTTKLMAGKDAIDSESKSLTDEFAFIAVNKIK